MDNYISIKQVLDDILHHPLLQDVTFERAINYAVELMRIVGCPRIFYDKQELLHVEDHRVKMPCDCISIIQVKDCDSGKCFRLSTDSFHYTYDDYDIYDLTYKVQNTVMYTSIREGDIEIAYRSIYVDSDGYPMIPDDATFIRALEMYIKKRQFTILFDLGKISLQVLQNTQRDYAWAVGQAQSSLTMPTIDEMQSIANSWCTLVSRVSQHSEGFRTNGNQEKIRRQ